MPVLFIVYTLLVNVLNVPFLLLPKHPSKSTHPLRVSISTLPLLVPILKNSARISSKVLLILLRRSSATLRLTSQHPWNHLGWWFHSYSPYCQTCFRLLQQQGTQQEHQPWWGCCLWCDCPGCCPLWRHWEDSRPSSQCCSSFPLYWDCWRCHDCLHQA